MGKFVIMGHLQYQLCSDVTLGTACKYLDLSDGNNDRACGLLKVAQKGNLEKNYIHFLDVNLIWKF